MKPTLPLQILFAVAIAGGIARAQAPSAPTAPATPVAPPAATTPPSPGAPEAPVAPGTLPEQAAPAPAAPSPTAKTPAGSPTAQASLPGGGAANAPADITKAKKSSKKHQSKPAAPQP